MESKFCDNPLPKCNRCFLFGGKVSLYDFTFLNYRNLRGEAGSNTTPIQIHLDTAFVKHDRVAAEHNCLKSTPSICCVPHFCDYLSYFLWWVKWIWIWITFVNLEMKTFFREYLWKALYEGDSCSYDLVISYSAVTSFLESNLRKIFMNIL